MYRYIFFWFNLLKSLELHKTRLFNYKHNYISKMSYLFVNTYLKNKFRNHWNVQDFIQNYDINN